MCKHTGKGHSHVVQTEVVELGLAYLELGRFDDAAYVSTTMSGDSVEVLSYQP